jgi:hypothetical protein
MATVGFGDIVPTTRVEVVTVIVIALFGTSVFGFVIASVSQLVMKGVDSFSARAQHRLKEMRGYLVSARGVGVGVWMGGWVGG